MPWGITYSHPHSLSAIRYVPVHPVQLYEALGALLIFWVLGRRARRKFSEGTLFFWGLASYAALRFGVEFFRGDEYRGFLVGGRLSLAQFLSLAILFIVSLRRCFERPVQVSS